jgi:hypothetical protein
VVIRFLAGCSLKPLGIEKQSRQRLRARQIPSYTTLGEHAKLARKAMSQWLSFSNERGRQLRWPLGLVVQAPASDVTRVDQRSRSNEVVNLAPRNPNISELPVAQVFQPRSQALADSPGIKSVKISREKVGGARPRYGSLCRSRRNIGRAHRYLLGIYPGDRANT